MLKAHITTVADVLNIFIVTFGGISVNGQLCVTTVSGTKSQQLMNMFYIINIIITSTVSCRTFILK